MPSTRIFERAGVRNHAGTQISFFPKQDIRGLVDGPELRYDGCNGRE